MHSSHQPHVGTGVIRHHHAPHGPVYDIHTSDVARAYGHVGTLAGTCLAQRNQVLGIVAEIGIHLYDIVIPLRKPPLEAHYVGCPESQLALAFKQVQPAMMRLLPFFYYLRRAIGRIVINYKNVETIFQPEHGLDDIGDIFFFIIGRYNHQAIRPSSIT